MMNIIEFERELNAHDAAVKCRNAANKLQNNIFRVYCRDQSTENHHKHGKANVDTLLAGAI